MSYDPLPALAALEQRYDGPIPESLLRAVRLGSPVLVELLLTEGQARFFKDMAQGQFAIIRRRREDGSLYAGLFADLALYRRHWRAWGRQARRLREALDSKTPPPAMPLAAE